MIDCYAALSMLQRKKRMANVDVTVAPFVFYNFQSLTILLLATKYLLPRGLFLLFVKA